MRVAVLGSGSRGNAVALSSNGETVLVDAGFGIKTLERRARASGITLDSLRAVLLTHEHGDHARGAARLSQRTGATVFGSTGTLDALRESLAHAPVYPLTPHEPVSVGRFTVTGVPTSHDAAEPLAFLVRDGSDGPSVGLAYDLGRPTQGVRYLLRQATCLVLEANHDDVLLRTGPYPASVRTRIAGPGGHLSNRDAAELASTLCHDALSTVVLVHLSDRCNTPYLAERAVRTGLERSGFRGRLLVAKQEEPLAPFEI
jgi:phosphoribosyl 1,2-cyclic phosphodiesterase